jgi:hypothetical protein
MEDNLPRRSSLTDRSQLTLAKHLFRITLALSVTLCGAPFVHAAAIPYPNSGTLSPITYTFTATTTGDVIAYFAGSTASYTEFLGMEDNGVLTSAGFGLNDHTSSVGQTFDLGAVTAGDTLTFVLDVTSPNLGYAYSSPALNTSYDTDGSLGHNHVYSVPYSSSSGLLPSSIPSGTYVAFEDLPFPNSNFNYFDETYVFTNVSTNVGPTSATPVPASLTLLGVGIAGLAWRMRRRRNLSF